MTSKVLDLGMLPVDRPDLGVEQAVAFLLRHGATVIWNGDNYFSYMIDGRFGHFTQQQWAFSLSSCYIPSRDNGTGAQYKAEAYRFTLNDFKCAANYAPSWLRTRPQFYQSLDQFINGVWNKQEAAIMEVVS